MKKLLLFAALLPSLVSGEVRLDKMWEFSQENSMKPAWMGTNTERSMACHDGMLYVVSRNGGNKLLQLSAADGSLVKSTNLTGLANGTLKGNNIGVTDDGQILVGSAGQQGFSIQKIDKTTGVATDLLASPSSNVKNGGRIDGWGVAGTMDHGVIAVPVSYVAGTSNGGNEVMLFNIREGKVTNAGSPEVVANVNGVSATATMVDENSFYVLSATFTPRYISNDGGWAVAADQFAADAYVPTCAGGVQFDYQGKTYFVSAGGSQYGAMRFFDVADGRSGSAAVFTTPPVGTTENTFSKTNPVCAEVRSDGAYVYLLSTNNGIAAYRLYDTSVFAGTYTVGNGGDYRSLTEAMADITARREEVKGDITLKIVSDIEETSNLSMAVDMYPYRLTIRPDKEELRTIKFSSAAANASGIHGACLFGAGLQQAGNAVSRNIVVDGNPAGGTGRFLKIETTQSSHAKTPPVAFYGDTRSVTIRNCIIENNAAITGIANNYAVCFRRSGDVWPQDIVLENNEIRNLAGISSDAVAPDLQTSGGSGTMSGIRISGNDIHAKARGIIVGYTDGMRIESNTFHISQTASGLVSSALLGFGTVKGTVSVDGNRFTEMSTANTTATGGCKTIVTEGTDALWVITNNFFGGFEKTSASGSSAFSCVECLTPCQIVHNTFVLNSVANKPSSYQAVNVQGAALKALNNNLFVSREASAANVFMSGVPAGVGDCNVYCFDASNEAVSFDGTSRTLAEYTANTGNDAHSAMSEVNFVDERHGDFHIAKSSIGAASLSVARLEGVEKDIDGDVRAESTVAGADEPQIPVIAVPTALRATEVTDSGFTANWSEVAGATSYRLSVYTKEPLVYVVENQSVVETSFDVTGLTAATNYYYRVSAIDGQFESAQSNEIFTRTKDTYVEGEGYEIPGFVTSPYFDEQVMAYTYNPDVKVEINAPSAATFDPEKPTALVLYGLPNGNSTDWTIGKQPAPGDDWHYQIQHIGAQTRFVRSLNPDFNLVTVYLEASSQSWGAWRSSVKNGDAIIKDLTDSLLDVFEGLNPYVVLSGHSGGGNFPFGFMDGVEEIPAYVKRIVFLDSNYNWDNDRYGRKLTTWLNASPDNRLVVVCYDDLNALLDGKPIVSATGGTWYRSQVMQKYLADNLQAEWTKTEDDSMIEHRTADKKIQFLMKKNPDRKIYHTVLVEKNGYIQSLLFGTPYENQGYEFWGDAAYSPLVQSATVYPHVLRIPPRRKDALSGSAFIEKIKSMPLDAREAAIYQEVAQGNVPDFYRKPAVVTTIAQDASGASKTVELSVAPDFVAIGTDDDFVRMPMLPGTAQRIATLFGASLPTRKISDLIHENSVVKLEPVTMNPDASMTTVPVFYEHNGKIEEARMAAGQPLHSLIAGHKKDIVITNRLTEPDRLFIYGWHYKDGTPIQPLSGAHDMKYVDYSHGVRLVNKEIMVDGVLTNIKSVLQDAGQYKLLSDEAGVMVKTEYDTGDNSVPAVPKSFALIPLSANSMKIGMTAVTGETYEVRYGLSPDKMDVIRPADAVLSELESGKVYYASLRASNLNGTSEWSETLAAVPSEKMEALVVNGFDRFVAGNTYDFVKEHGAALSANGVAFASATNEAVKSGLVVLGDYPFVDYILGEESTADKTFDPAEQTLVKTYLEQGGHLFVSAAEIGWDLSKAGASQFMKDYLKCSFVSDCPGASSGLYHNARIVSGCGFGDDGFGFAFADGTTTAVAYPDVLLPEDGAAGFLAYEKDSELYDTSIGWAGIGYCGLFPGGEKEGKVIVMGIPFETIVSASVRAELMGRILQYDYSNSGIQSVSGLSHVRIYPNPAGSEVCISMGAGEKAEVEIYDVNGRSVCRCVLENGSGQIDVSPWPGGVYFCRLTTGDKTTVEKLIVR